MYSVVLLAALTSGGEVPDSHRGSCGCHGGGHARQAHHGRHGCHGCAGGCYGGCTGVVAGCYGGCTGVVVGCYGGGYGMAPAMAPAPAAKPEKKTTSPDKDDEVSGPKSATVVVTLPADARLSVDGAPTTSTSSTRVFVSPALTLGQDFHYNLKAEVVRDGKPVVMEQRITVRAGQETRVTLAEQVGAVVRR
jgi:uncharacterized protein (TIGR03000 family)